MKISVIVPVYNTEAYLAECLDSLINQTWTDLEIICVNDGSSDNSAAILAKYAEKDIRIRVITQENGGLSAARNSGLRAAAGDYVCFVDSDDRLEKIACERLAMEILGKQPDLIVFGANTIPEGALEQDPWLKSVLTPRDRMFREGNLNELLLERGVRPFVWRNCIRRALLEAQQLTFDESVRYGEDTVFQLCLLPACRRVSFISDRLYDYRKDRPGSLMERLKQGRDKWAGYHLPLVETVAEYWKKKGWMSEHGDGFYGWAMEFVAYDIVTAEKEHRREYAERLLRLIDENNLNRAPHTQCALTFQRMVESVCGKNRVNCFLRVQWRRCILLAVRAYRRMRGSDCY